MSGVSQGDAGKSEDKEDGVVVFKKVEGPDDECCGDQSDDDIVDFIFKVQHHHDGGDHC